MLDAVETFCPSCALPAILCKDGCLGLAAAEKPQPKLGPVEAAISDFSGAKPVLTVDTALVDRGIVAFAKPVETTPNKLHVIWHDEEPHIDEFVRIRALPSLLRKLVYAFFAEGGEEVVTAVCKGVDEKHLVALANLWLGNKEGPTHV